MDANAILFRLMVVFFPGILAYVFSLHLRGKKLETTAAFIYSFVYGFFAYLSIWVFSEAFAKLGWIASNPILDSVLSTDKRVSPFLVVAAIPVALVLALIWAYAAGKHLIARGAKKIGISTAEYEAVNQTIAKELPVAEPITSSEVSVAPTEPQETLPSADAVVKAEEKPSVGKLIDLVVEAKYEEAESYYQELLSREVGERARLELEAMYRQLLFRRGDQNAFARLLEIDAQLEHKSSRVVFLIGLCFESSDQLLKAEETYRKAAALSDDDEDKASKFGLAARCFRKLGKTTEAIKVLLDGEQTVQTSKAKSTLFRRIAEFYKELSEPVLSLVALEVAIQCIPNDTDLRFKAAYEYANLGLPEAALLHYRSVVSFNPSATGALNNLGLVFDTLGMPLHAVEQFREAASMGETLSSANMASRLLNAGFVEEARAILEAVKSGDDVHERVLANLHSIGEKQEHEDKEEEEAAQKGRTLHEFFLTGSGALFPKEEFSIEGEWSSGQIRFQIKKEKCKYEASFFDYFGMFKFTALAFGKVLNVKFYDQKGSLKSILSGTASTSPIEYEESGSGVAYLSDDLSKLYMIRLPNKEKKEYERHWVFERVKSHS